MKLVNVGVVVAPLLLLAPTLAHADDQGAVVGAGTGAVAGAVVGGPVGAILGAGAGAVIGGAASDAPRTVVIERRVRPAPVIEEDVTGSVCHTRTTERQSPDGDRVVTTFTNCP